jgi:hypothetical protein
VQYQESIGDKDFASVVSSVIATRVEVMRLIYLPPTISCAYTKTPMRKPYPEVVFGQRAIQITAKNQ